MDPYLFDPPAQERRQLFLDKGWGEPPYKAEERYSLAVEMVKNGQEEKALALHDPIVDCQDWKFSELAASLYEDIDAPYCDLEKAQKYYRRAFEIADGEDNYRNAWYYLRAYFKANNTEEQELPFLYKNKFVLNCILATIMQNWDLPDPMDWAKRKKTKLRELYGPYLLASFIGAGNGIEQDHEQAIEIYEAYIEEVDRGLIGASYTNLSLRYALGLGTDADINEAMKLEILSQKIDNPDLDGISLDLIDIYERITEGMKNPAYKARYEALVKQASKSINNPMEIFNQTTEYHDYPSIEQQAFIDFLLLANLLSKRENWTNNKYWNVAYRQTLINYRSLIDVDHILTQEFSPFIYATFDEDIREGEKSKFELSPEEQKKFKAQIRLRKRLKNYFKDHGLGEPPYSSIDRLSKCNEFIHMIPPQYNHAYALFDEEIDGEDHAWLAQAAFILDMHLDNDDLFNATKAERFNRKAADLGSSMAAFNLGTKYQSGNDEQAIDLDEALKWYRRAVEIGDNEAKSRIANILKLQRELDEPNIDNPYTDEIIELYKEGQKAGYIFAANQVAKFYINGIGRSKNGAKAVSIYEEILNLNAGYSEEVSQVNTALIMAIRSFLGLDMDKNNRKALEYINKIPDKSNHSTIRYYLQEWKQLVKRFVDQEKNLSELSILRDLYESPEKIAQIIDEIDKGSIRVNGRFVNYVSCFKWLSQNEEWSSQYDWNDLAEAAQAKLLGHSFAEAVQSTKDSGPRYNPLDDRGMPILGVLMKPSSDEDAENTQRVTTGSYVPQPGLIALHGIDASPEGFKYSGIYSENIPAMLTLEDLQVAEILVFGDPKKGPLFPSLSLETENNDELGKGAEGSGYEKAFTYKIFDPQWLAYTDFGRTLWITDYLIGQWCWSPERFKVGSPDSCSSPQQHSMAKNFIKDLRLTGGRDGGASSARVMIQPKSNYILPEAPETTYKKDSASVEIKEMTMKVYGSYILNDWNTENRSLFEEDPNFAQGRTVKKLTDRYNDIMKLDPRFERAQQLMGLFYGQLRLWQLGYRPSDNLQRELSARLKAMNSLGRDKDEKLLVRRTFGLRPY